MRQHTLASSIALALLMTTAARSHAAPPPEAQLYEAAGERAFKLQEFRKAIDEFRAAYQLNPSPVLLYNLAQCHRHLGDNEQAVFFYKQYLNDAPPDGTFRRAAAETVERLEKLVEESRKQQNGPPVGIAPMTAVAAAPTGSIAGPGAASSRPPRSPGEGTDTTATAGSRGSTPRSDLIAAPSAPATAPGHGLDGAARSRSRTWVWGVVAAAAVVVGGGVAAALVATSGGDASVPHTAAGGFTPRF